MDNKIKVFEDKKIRTAWNEEKEEWRQHITDIFYKRYLVITNYYYEEIEKLPF